MVPNFLKSVRQKCPVKRVSLSEMMERGSPHSLTMLEEEVGGVASCAWLAEGNEGGVLGEAFNDDEDGVDAVDFGEAGDEVE